MHDTSDTVKFPGPCFRIFTESFTHATGNYQLTRAAHGRGTGAYSSTRLSSFPIVSMNSSTMSRTTARVGRIRSSEPTT